MGRPPLKPYSVVLLMPEYVCDDWPATRYDHVKAARPDDALRKARRNGVADVMKRDCGIDVNPEDFAPILVIEGHHDGLPLGEEYI